MYRSYRKVHIFEKLLLFELVEIVFMQDDSHFVVKLRVLGILRELLIKLLEGDVVREPDAVALISEMVFLKITLMRVLNMPL